MGLLVIYLSIALGVSFTCSIMESVLLSSNMSFIETRINKGSKAAIVMKDFKNNIDRPLSAILSLNTVAHTIGAAGVGAQAVKVFGEPAFGVVSVILTILILVITEIIPKTIGAKFWRILIPLSARVTQLMVLICYPLVLMSEIITSLITRNQKQEIVTKEEIAILAEIAHKEGIFEEKESKIINNILKLKDITLKDIMTPRTVVVSAPEDITVEEMYENKSFLNFSRIPIYKGTIDNITGYVLKDVILSKLVDNKINVCLSDLKRSVTISYQNSSISTLFEKMLYKREHISIVVNEHGGFQGIVTMEDIIETLLGLEIVDESDEYMNLQKKAKEKYKKFGKFYRKIPK